MLKRVAIIAAAAASLAWAAGSWADSYLIEPSLAACQARSAAQCAAMDCAGVTQYWWACVGPLNAGSATTAAGNTVTATNESYALDLQEGGPYAATTSNGTGLSADEQANEVSADGMASANLLPGD